MLTRLMNALRRQWSGRGGGGIVYEAAKGRKGRRTGPGAADTATNDYEGRCARWVNALTTEIISRGLGGADRHANTHRRPRPRTERSLGSGDAAGQQQWPRKASHLERSDALSQALHASETFLGDRGEVFCDAKALRKQRRWTKRQLEADDAAGRTAAADAPDAPQQ